jgi:predicted RNA-binding protein YlqC (UPF0109 family)
MLKVKDSFNINLTETLMQTLIETYQSLQVKEEEFETGN